MNSRLLPSLIALLLLLVSGCGDDEIRRYKVKKKPKTSPKHHHQHHHHEHADKPKGPQVPMRILAAIIPHGEKIWFFKVLAPDKAIEPHRDSFDAFIKSIHFPEKSDAKEKIHWTINDQWKVLPGNSMRYATIEPEPGNSKLQLTVIPLGKIAGNVLDNVNRWRGQLGLGNLTEAELPKHIQSFSVKNTTATIVDIRQPKQKMEGSGSFSAGTLKDKPKDFSYTLPEGWKVDPKPHMMRRASFLLPSPNKKADVSVTSLGGMAGGLLSNVNRWRGQVGLSNITQAELEKSATIIQIDGNKGHYFELINSADKSADAIYVVSASIKNFTWFFKMKGPADDLAKEKENFKAFVQSVRFNPEPAKQQ